jgi:hypothetical protein
MPPDHALMLRTVIEPGWLEREARVGTVKE